MARKLKLGAIVSYLFSVVSIAVGFQKMFIYENPDSAFLDPKNAYVGGDAYNYIINANYATGYFTLAIFCAVIGLSFILVGLLQRNNELHNARAQDAHISDSKVV